MVAGYGYGSNLPSSGSPDPFLNQDLPLLHRQTQALTRAPINYRSRENTRGMFWCHLWQLLDCPDAAIFGNLMKDPPSCNKINGK